MKNPDPVIGVADAIVIIASAFLLTFTGLFTLVEFFLKEDRGETLQWLTLFVFSVVFSRQAYRTLHVIEGGVDARQFGARFKGDSNNQKGEKVKRIRLLGRGNGGDQSKIDALLGLYPYLKTICGGHRVSVLQLIPPMELPANAYSCCLMGHNSDGRVYLIKNKTITVDRSWREMRQLRKTLGLGEPFLNSPQAELSGDEEACILVQNHHAEGNENDRWISVDAFLCPQGNIFRDYPAIEAWLAEIPLRNELREAGFIR